ncbi:MAG: glycosyltransferase 87 family protein, partial [Propionibacteriaceae bacterium]|nr:glycosyltransferase 87 family protein [Propionibacteriaceae bacterium]
MKLPKPSLARFFGGPPGAHALLGRHEWPLAAPFAFGMLTLNWVVLMLRQVPCMRGENRYTSMCYTDLVALFQTRDWANDSVSFISNQLEYPVLTGVLIDALRKVQQWLTPVGAQDAAASDIFFGVNAVVLFALLLVMVGAHLRLSRPGDAMLIACSPAILTAGLINWDALAMALVALGLLAWARRHPLLAGALIGLGAAAKLYPLLLLVPLVVLCLRANRLNECALAVGGAILAWLAVNAPVYFLN